MVGLLRNARPVDGEAGACKWNDVTVEGLVSVEALFVLYSGRHNRQPFFVRVVLWWFCKVQLMIKELAPTEQAGEASNHGGDLVPCHLTSARVYRWTCDEAATV